MGIFDRLNSFVKENITDRFTNYLYDLGVKAGVIDDLDADEIESGLTNSLFDRVTRPIQDIISKFRDDTDAFNYYTRLDFNEVPDMRNVRKVDWISSDYGYVIEYDVYGIDGNLVGTQTSRIDTDRVLTQEELFQILQDNYETSSGVFLSMVQDIRIIGALRR